MQISNILTNLKVTVNNYSNNFLLLLVIVYYPNWKSKIIIFSKEWFVKVFIILVKEAKKFRTMIELQMIELQITPQKEAQFQDAEK